jgi:hypothetical protein
VNAPASSRPARRAILVAGVVLALVAAFWLARREAPLAEFAHVARRQATLWSHWGQVRQPVAELRYGVRVAILDRREEQVRVRTEAGREGWLRADQLMTPEVWQHTLALVAEARDLPVQARAATKVRANLRATPGRDGPLIFTLGPGVKAELLRRATAERPAEPDAPARREDWWLVRAAPEDAGEIAGWVLGRFLEPALPTPLAERAGRIRFVAWFELNRVADPARGEQPQYLAVGVAGPEGGTCDFTLLRVFTWNRNRARYETAFVESALCGRLPVLVAEEGGWPTFRFSAIGLGGEEQRAYQLRQTVVRRLRE